MIHRVRTLRRLALLPAIVVAGFAAPALAASAALIAHRAVYDLTLGRTEGSSAPSTARGRIVYEFTGSACEGWVTNFRQVTELQSGEGASRISDMRSSTFEEGDGSSFQFKSDTFVDGKKIDSVDGKARRSDDGVVSVNLSSPANAKTNFPGGAVFPTAQILRIIDAARSGEKTAQIKIFDGSDSGKKAFDTMTIIGHPTDSPPVSQPAAVQQPDALRGVMRWPVSVSYFDPGKKDGAPNYILGFDLYENGVSGSLHIDYGNYVLEGTMTKFETLPQKDCSK